MNRVIQFLVLFVVATSCSAQTQVTEMKSLVGRKAVAQRMPFYQPGTYQTIPNTYAGQTVTIIDVKPSAMFAAMPKLTERQMASLPAASRANIENVRNAATIVVQFADGTKADTGAIPVMPSMLPSYLEVISDPAASSSMAATSDASASPIPANPISSTNAKTDLAISSADKLSDDQVRLTLAGNDKNHDNASPGAPILKTPERIKEAFDNCIRANLKTEFDTAETLLARAATAPCRFGGVATYRGRGDELAGDILQYDARRQVTYWDIPLLDNVRYGQIALPYDFPLGRGGDKKEFTKEQKAEVKAMTNTSFLILPLYGEKDVADTYEAANGFGAKATVISLRGVRYSLGVNMGKQRMVGQSFRIASAPLPRDKAPDLIPNLDVQLYWMAAKPCEECLSGGQADTGTLGGPTFSNPQDVHLLQNYVFARLVAVYFVDRRDGKTYAISTGDQAFLAK